MNIDVDIPTLPKPETIEAEITRLRGRIAELRALLTPAKRQHAARLIAGQDDRPAQRREARS